MLRESIQICGMIWVQINCGLLAQVFHWPWTWTAHICWAGSTETKRSMILTLFCRQNKQGCLAAIERNVHAKEKMTRHIRALSFDALTSCLLLLKSHGFNYLLEDFPKRHIFRAGWRHQPTSLTPLFIDSPAFLVSKVQVHEHPDWSDDRLMIQWLMTCCTKSYFLCCWGTPSIFA